jgi:hypothetical protein
MSHGQTLLAIGAVILFGLAMLGIYHGIQSHQKTLIECEVLPRAILHAERFIEEARTRAFDEATVSRAVANADELTPPDSIGPDDGEIYPSFDDVDDFHDLTKTWQEDGIDFQAHCVVNYADGILPDPIQDVSYATFVKRFSMTVTSPYLDYTVSLNHIFAYY